MGIDVDRLYPNQKQKQWLAAQTFIVDLENSKVESPYVSLNKHVILLGALL